MKASIMNRIRTELADRYVDPFRYRVGVATIQSSKARYDDFSHLWDSEVQVYSQWGEDGILEFICSRIGLHRPRAVELGCGNFRECNTRFLAEFRQASVVAVDARKDLLPSAMALPLFWQTVILPVEAWITPDSAPALLANARSSLGGIDLLSLDIDGNDYWVLDSLDLEGIEVVVVEYNSALGGLLPVTVPRDDHFDRTKAHFSWLYYGASLRAWIHLLGSRGFDFVGSNRACTNAFFVRRDQTSKLRIKTPDINHLEFYLDCRVRESRDTAGAMDYQPIDKATAIVGHLPLVDVEHDRLVTVKQAREGL